MTESPLQTPSAHASEETALMARYGISRTVVHHFAVDGFRYTNLADAVAQAKRRSQPDSSA